jgi:hypothetical protein
MWMMAAALSVLALNGCGYEYTYAKPGVSRQEMARDHYECKQGSNKMAFLGTSSTLAGGEAPDWTTYRECLEARGYTVEVN